MSHISVKNAQTWSLSGELSFATVTALLAEFESTPSLPQVIDLEKITRTDSAGLALLIEFCKRSQPSSLVFHNIPEQLLTLAKVSGVQDILLSA
jgi:phospholipid transport system transporter-binding protein